jgi:hypothetical protein
VAVLHGLCTTRRRRGTLDERGASSSGPDAARQLAGRRGRLLERQPPDWLGVGGRTRAGAHFGPGTAQLHAGTATTRRGRGRLRAEPYTALYQRSIKSMRNHTARLLRLPAPRAGAAPEVAPSRRLSRWRARCTGASSRLRHRLRAPHRVHGDFHGAVSTRQVLRCCVLRGEPAHPGGAARKRSALATSPGCCARSLRHRRRGRPHSRSRGGARGRPGAAGPRCGRLGLPRYLRPGWRGGRGPFERPPARSCGSCRASGGRRRSRGRLRAQNADVGVVPIDGCCSSSAAGGLSQEGRRGARRCAGLRKLLFCLTARESSSGRFRRQTLLRAGSTAPRASMATYPCGVRGSAVSSRDACGDVDDDESGASAI